MWCINRRRLSFHVYLECGHVTLLWNVKRASAREHNQLLTKNKNIYTIELNRLLEFII